jgi:hypothetical protein
MTAALHPRLSGALAPAAFAIAMLMAVPATLAQGSGDVTGLQSGTGEESSAGNTVHVGAGTASGVTTGYSGAAAAESEDDGGGPPPLPSAELCSDFEGQPAHAACLATVLGEDTAMRNEGNGGEQ